MKRTTGVHMARTLAAGAATCGLLLSLGALAGCRSGSDEAPARIQPPPLLYVTPRAVEVTAGRGAVTFTALLRGVNGPVDWALGGPGSLSGSSGAYVAYRPPDSVAATTTVELRAFVALANHPTGAVTWLEDRVNITVVPPASPLLGVTPGDACLLAGSGPARFAVRLENASSSIAWSLEPAGVGTLSASVGPVVEYTPPALVAAPTFVKVVAAGAGLNASAAVTVVSRVPTVTPVVETLTPERTVAGGPDVALTVNGTGFAPGATVLWNGAPRATAFAGCTRLVAAISQADVAIAGAQQVSVTNPGSVRSNALAFAVDHRLMALVNVARNGTVANGRSYPGTAVTEEGWGGQGLRPVISADGRFVAFASWASNLVPGDALQNGEIFLRDTCYGAPPGCIPGTERVSPPGDGLVSNDDPVLTPDGRFVAFARLGDAGSPSGIYLRDTCRGAPPGCRPATEYVSLPADSWVPAPLQPDAWRGRFPAISQNGRFVAFYSEWSLAPGSIGAGIYLRDTCRGAPAGCSVATRLVAPIRSVFHYEASVGISTDGRFVSFDTAQLDPFFNGLPDMFVSDTCHGAPAGCVPSTERVSVGTGGEAGNGITYHGSLSPSGRFAVFASWASNLVPGDGNGTADIFVRDTCHGAPAGCTPGTELVSVAHDGSPGNGPSYSPQVSADGRLVVFMSLATNLVLDGIWSRNGPGDVFLRDTCRGAGPACSPSTIRLRGAGYGSEHDAGSTEPSISADGRVVVVSSWRPSLWPSGPTGQKDVFLIATCADRASPGCVPSGALRVNASTTGLDADPDGYLVRLHRRGAGAWDSARAPTQGTTVVSALPPDTYEVTLAGMAPNCDPVSPAKATVAVAPGETAEVSFNVVCSPTTHLAFEYAQPSQTDTTLFLVGSNGTGALPIRWDGLASELDPAFAPGGARIAFTSAERHTVCWGTTALVADPSAPYLEMGATCLDEPVAAYQPSWSPDGTRLAFVSERDGNPEIYLVAADWTGPVRLTSDPAADLHPAWAPDGTRIAFARADAAGSRIWVMGADGSGAALLTSDQAEETTPAWSPDGRRIAYSRRVCRDSSAGRECEPWDVYVREADGTAGPVALGSPLADALDPAWSPDGRKIAYSYRLRDSATALHDHLSAIAVVRADGNGPDLADPLRDEFIFGLGERPTWSW